MENENKINEACDPIEANKIINSGNQAMIDRVAKQLGQDFLQMSKDIAACFDTGDFDNSDPRIRTSNRIHGQESSKGNKER